MDEFIHATFAAIRLATFVGGSGAMFALGVVSVCRWMKWAPINITVNVNNHAPSPQGD